MKLLNREDGSYSLEIKNKDELENIAYAISSAGENLCRMDDETGVSDECKAWIEELKSILVIMCKECNVKGD